MTNPLAGDLTSRWAGNNTYRAPEHAEDRKAETYTERQTREYYVNNQLRQLYGPQEPRPQRKPKRNHT